MNQLTITVFVPKQKDDYSKAAQDAMQWLIDRKISLHSGQFGISFNCDGTGHAWAIL